MSTTTIESTIETADFSDVLTQPATNKLGSLALIKQLMHKKQIMGTIDPDRNSAQMDPCDRALPNLRKALLFAQSLVVHRHELTLPSRPSLLYMTGLVYSDNPVGDVAEYARGKRYDALVAAGSDDYEYDKTLLANLAAEIPDVTLISVDEKAVRLHAVSANLTSH